MTGSGLATLRILIVEDHPGMRTIIKQMLKAGGVTKIKEASDGAEALKCLRDPLSKPPHLIISDLHMPELDGIGLCNAIRRDQRLEIRGIPILILTGEEDEFVHEVAEQVGAARILTKPVSPADLFECVGQAVGF